MKKLLSLGALAFTLFTSLFAVACEERTIFERAKAEPGTRVAPRGEGERELTSEEARARREVDLAGAEADRARAEADKHNEAADALDEAAEAREEAAEAAAEAARKQAEATAKETEARAKEAEARAPSTTSPSTTSPSTTSPSTTSPASTTSSDRLEIAPDADTAPAMDSHATDAGPQ